MHPSDVNGTELPSARELVFNKLIAISHMKTEEQKAYDTAFTHAFIQAVYR